METKPLIPGNILFVDVETVPCKRSVHDLPDELGDLFERKAKQFIDEKKSYQDFLEEVFRDKAGLYAEFNQIVCVVLGRVDKEGNLLLKTIASRFEKQLLSEVAAMIMKTSGLVAHNGKEFDYPMLFRRMLIHGIDIPNVLNPIGKKPWELNMMDTMVDWSGTQWNHKVSLELIANCFGIPTPKSDMTGADVAKVYYSMFDGIESDELPFEKEKAVLDKIGAYCQLDVITLAKLFARLRGYKVPEQVQFVV